MNVPRYSVSAARLLARHVTRRVATTGERERERGLETITRALRRSARRHWLWRGAAALAASAAAFTLLWQVTRENGDEAPKRTVISIDVSPLGRGATLRGPAGAQPLDTSLELRSDQAIETALGGGASLRLSTGTRIDLESATTFRIADRGPTERFVLTRGELSTSVAKLGLGQRFIVETPDAEIEVRGTQFRLKVLSQGEACGAGSRTRLDVDEGAVEVRSAGRSARVGAGASWPLDCAPSAVALPSRPGPNPTEGEHPELEAQPKRRLPSEASGRSTHTAVKSAPALSAGVASALTRQNDLFAEAVAARRRGDVAGALRAYRDLISQFPASPLVENAMVERMRLLAAENDERAHNEAERYLARYPRGFAVDEAHRLVGPR